MKNIILLLLSIYSSHTLSNEVSGLLSEYRWSQRVLLIFSPNVNNVSFVKQRQLLAGEGGELEDRDLVIVEVVQSHGVFINSLHTDYLPLQFLNHFSIESDAFHVALIGKDGGIKPRFNRPIEVRVIYDTIDAMPMRQREMRNE